MRNNLFTNQIYLDKSEETDTSHYSVKPEPEKEVILNEQRFFTDNGYTQPIPLLTQKTVKLATENYFEFKDKFLNPFEMEILSNHHSFLKRPWFKSMHAFVPLYFDIICHPAIVNRVTSILGEDIIAWGTTVTYRKPKQKHRWHVDIEHRYWKGVTVFIGLKGTSKNSSLKLISNSQSIGFTPQEINIQNDIDAIRNCKEIIPNSELIKLDIKEGEFIIFDGLLWHGSENETNNDRLALIIQYSTPNYQIRIPTCWDEPVKWHSYKPPCVLVNGTDCFGLNELINQPIEFLN